MESDKNPFLQMSHDQIEKIEAVLSSEQARALLMETSKQNMFCGSKLDDVLSHEDGGTQLDLHKFPPTLDAALEDSLQDLEHLVLGQHGHSELFAEASDDVGVASEILHNEITVNDDVDTVKLDHPYSLAFVCEEEFSPPLPAEGETNDEESIEYADQEADSKLKSPPIRRSQRQIDKIEREQVEKIRAENVALQLREKEEMKKQKGESCDVSEQDKSDKEENSSEDASQSNSNSKQSLMNIEPHAGKDSSFEEQTSDANGDNNNMCNTEVKSLVGSNSKTPGGLEKKGKRKTPTKNDVDNAESVSKAQLKTKSPKDVNVSSDKGIKNNMNAENRKKTFKKEKQVEIAGPQEPELFSTPDKIVKQRSDSFSEANERKQMDDFILIKNSEISTCNEMTNADKLNVETVVSDEKYFEETQTDNCSVEVKMPKNNSTSPRQHQNIQLKMDFSQKVVKQIFDSSSPNQQQDEKKSPATEKQKSLTMKKTGPRLRTSKPSCDVRRADSSSDAKKEKNESGDDDDVGFIDDPNDSDWASDDDPEKLWCICRKPCNNRFMIQCDLCEEWFHGTCVGVTKQQGRQMEKEKREWKCPSCTKSLAVETQKLSKLETTRSTAKVDRSNPHQQCVICNSLVSKDSIYCSSTCIEKHAKEILSVLQKKVKRESKEKHSERIVVLDTRTGKLLNGPNAPTEENLVTWLQAHPTFQALKPGLSSKESKSIVLPSATAEKKLKEPAKEKTTSQNDILLVRKNVIKTLTDILLSRCKSDGNISVKPDQVKKIATDIEEELFKCFKDTGTKYKAKYRSLMFNVKDPRNQGLFRKIVKGKIPPDQLVRMSPEELASKELAKWRERENQHTLEMIKKEQLEKQSAPPTYVKKTHKGEVEIEDGSSFIIEKEETKVLKETTLDTKEMLADTTIEHRAHLFDLNCKICTGRMPPPEEEDIAAKKAKISHTINVEKEQTVLLVPEKETLLPKKVQKSVKIVGKSHRKKDDISDSEPTSTVCFGSPEHKQRSKKPKSKSSVWKGFIFMAEVAKFVTNAYKVSGPTDSLSVDIPDTVQVCGRIAPEEVWSYLSKIKQSGNKEIIIMRFQPTNEEEKTAYDDFYNYLNSRKRYGVVRNSSKMIKDFYIIPLPSRSPVPTVLMPFEGPGLDATRPNLLLGVIVRHKGKMKVITHQSARPKIPMEKPQSQVFERSYTPPLESMPCQSTAIDSSNSPAYVSSFERDARASPLKRSHTDDEPYEPSYTPPLEKFAKVDRDDDSKPYDPEEVENSLSTNQTAKSQDSEEPRLLSNTNSNDLEAQKKLLAELTWQVEVQKEQIELQKSLSVTATHNPQRPIAKDTSSVDKLLLPQNADGSKSDTNLPHTLQNILDNIKKKTQDLKESGQVCSNQSMKQNSPPHRTTTLSTMSAEELLEKAERELEGLKTPETLNPEPPTPPAPVVKQSSSVTWHPSTFSEPPPPGIDHESKKVTESMAYQSYANPQNPVQYPAPNPGQNVFIRAAPYHYRNPVTPHQNWPQQPYEPSNSWSYNQEMNLEGGWNADNTGRTNIPPPPPPPPWGQRDNSQNSSGKWQRWTNE